MKGITTLSCTLAVAVLFPGCKGPDPSQRIVFLDGAGHFGAGGSVKRGLRSAGYEGEFATFRWQSGLLWGVDHLFAANSDGPARKLVGEIELHRRQHPNGYFALMGLSSASAVILNALEQLPDDIDVDAVVLFQPSVSATRNLAPAVTHVRGNLYATCSQYDGIIGALLATADGGSLPAAGKTGFRVPLTLPASQRQPYTRVVNLPWQKKYRRWGWGGGHVSSTRSSFVKNVIAPHILGTPAPAPPTSDRSDIAFVPKK